MRFDVTVYVSLREGIADPAGSTIERALPALGYEGVSDVRVGKTIRFSIEADDAGSARSVAEDLSSAFLTNPVIEDAEVSVSGEAGDR